MTVGLRVRNGSNVYQIDETYQNYVFKTKGSSTTNTLYTYNLYYRDISVSDCIAPIIAIKSAGAFVILGGQVSGSTWTWRVLLVGNASAFDYYVFDIAPVDLSSGPALRIKHPVTGVPIYSSKQKPLRICPGNLVSNGLWPYPDETVFAPGRVLAGMQLSWGFGESEINDVTGERENWYGACAPTTGSMYYEHLTYAKIGVGYQYIASETTAVFLAVDVTNY